MLLLDGILLGASEGILLLDGIVLGEPLGALLGVSLGDKEGGSEGHATNSQPLLGSRVAKVASQHSKYWSSPYSLQIFTVPWD